jgi:hypothetical protein
LTNSISIVMSSSFSSIFPPVAMEINFPAAFEKISFRIGSNLFKFFLFSFFWYSFFAFYPTLLNLLSKNQKISRGGFVPGTHA